MAAAPRRHPFGVASRLLIATALFVAMLGAVAAAWAPVRAGTTHLVEIEEFAFSPSTLVITAGDTVTWTNLDAVEHTATSTTGAFDSGLLGQGESWSMTFTTPGTYDYLCTPHPSMTGSIVVEAAPAAPSAAPSSAPGGDGGAGGLPDVAMEAPRSADLRVPLGLALVAIALGLVLVRRRTTS